jgi:glycosyltransferase involved in cell wall biosynthesis
MRPIAFYAPMKPPAHPVPSGDRQIARGLLELLSDGPSGAEVETVSTLRSHEKFGSPERQRALVTQAEDEVARLIEYGQKAPWSLWVTYHNYYKAPDLIGPQVSNALGLPYVIFEASRAKKRLSGPWAAFERRAELACDAADILFSFTERDSIALRTAQHDGQSLVRLPPFLLMDRLPRPATAHSPPKLLTIAMMRDGDKLASYRRLAKVLHLLSVNDWMLEIIGDGPVEATVRALFTEFGPRVAFRGALDRAGVQKALSTASLFLWPGINEAFGLAYLEAQAAGVPVVAEDRPGVREVVLAGGLVPAEDPKAYADKVTALLRDDALRTNAASAGRRQVERHHLLPAARAVVWRELAALRGVRP